MLQWECYKRRAEVAGQPTVDELSVYMEILLERLAESNGAGKCTTEEELKQRINTLAVKGYNLLVLVNMVHFMSLI